MHALLTTLMHHALSGTAPDRDIAERLPRLAETNLVDCMAAARAAATMGKRCSTFTCGIVNVKSGRCQENCAFCAQSAHFTADTPSYPLLSADTLLRRAEALAAAGADYMGLVASGTRPTRREVDALCETAEKIRTRFPLKLCASLGLLERYQGRVLRQAGFSRYHHNLETAASHYPAICTTHAYELREQTVRAAREAGLSVCSGGIFGLGESWEQRLELSGRLDELAVNSIPVNFLTPVAGTPLAHRTPPSPHEALAVIAVLRLLHPDKDIVVCGGRGGALGRYETLVFAAGANGLMIGDYLTTKGGALAADRELIALVGGR